jgi:2-deoxy-D-gluconate 3-dehydrogenase
MSRITDLPRTPSLRLDGRVALVFGASSGIGLGCAVALAEAGAHVICAARGASRLEAAVSAMRAGGFSVEARVTDIADISAVRAAISSLERLDVMVNSAGIARHGPALDTREDDFDAVADTNWKAAHFAASAAAARMIEQKRGGSIITVSSQMAHVGGIDRAVYAASKHALEGMTKSMAIEWAKHAVRVNTICPTFVRTPLTEQTFANPERAAWVLEKIKLGRVAEVEDIMGAVLLLASDAGAMITGASLLIDGGWTAG